MSPLPDFSATKPGDLVVVTYWGTSAWANPRSIHPVASVTKTRVRVDGISAAGPVEFRRDTGTRVSDRGYGGSRIAPATPEVIAAIEMEQRHRRLISTIKATDWSKVSLPTLEQVAALPVGADQRGEARVGSFPHLTPPTIPSTLAAPMSTTTSSPRGKRRSTLPALPKRLPSIAVLNRRFAKMTIVQKRHTVARDALALLAAGKVEPTSGEWVTYYTPSPVSCDLQTVLRQPTAPSCSACALGGAICGLAWHMDATKLRSGKYDSDVRLTYYEDERKRLLTIWPEEQLMLIEHVFERGDGALGGIEEPDAFDDPAWDAYQRRRNRASRFHERYRTDRGLYRAIFRAILAHPEGLFVP